MQAPPLRQIVAMEAGPDPKWHLLKKAIERRKWEDRMRGKVALLTGAAGPPWARDGLRRRGDSLFVREGAKVVSPTSAMSWASARRRPCAPRP